MNSKFHKIYIGLFFAVGIFALIFLTINGLGYYSQPIERRFFSPDHMTLKPSGLIGHGLGIVGSLMMLVGVSGYMIRKRYRIFYGLGYLKHWLEFHIFLCTVGPMLVLFHTAFKFGGIVAVSFWSMVVVVLSGFAGRFIYVQIPRTIQGRELELQEMNEVESDFTNRINSELRTDDNLLSTVNNFCESARNHNFTILKTFSGMFKQHFEIRSIQTDLAKALAAKQISKESTKKILKTTKTKMTFARRIGMLRTMQNLFRYWHIFHLPFALSMFIIMAIHIAVTIAFGYKWIF